jgi:hypothetical protein
VMSRMRELGHQGEPLQMVRGILEDAVGQVLAFGKAPLELLRGAGGEEKVLKNAKDACATEALEIATYTALEEAARAVEDDVTATLARTIRAEEERMLERVLGEMPRLAQAVVDAQVNGIGSYSLATTGAAEVLREVAVGEAITNETGHPVTATGPSEPWPGYDELTVGEVRRALRRSERSLASRVRVYERSHKNRVGVIEAAERAPARA